MSAARTLPRLMLVFERRTGTPRAPADTLQASIAGGVGFVQWRERPPDDAGLAVVLASARAASPAFVVWTVNDRPALARRLDIGLHLPARSVGRAVPGGVWPVGRSVHDPSETDAALAAGCDYLVVGTVWPTASKPGREGIGVEGVRALARRAAPVPVYAIGGVEPGRAAALIAAGARGVAVQGALLRSADPRALAEALADEIRGAAASAL